MAHFYEGEIQKLLVQSDKSIDHIICKLSRLVDYGSIQMLGRPYLLSKKHMW